MVRRTITINMIILRTKTYAGTLSIGGKESLLKGISGGFTNSISKKAKGLVGKVRKLPYKIQAKSLMAQTTPIGTTANNVVESAIRRPDVAATVAAGQFVAIPVGLSVGGPVGTALLSPWGGPVTAAVIKKPLIPKKTLAKLDNSANKYRSGRFAKRLDNIKTTVGDVLNKGAEIAHTVPIPDVTI